MDVWTATLIFGFVVFVVGLYCANKANQSNHIDH